MHAPRSILNEYRGIALTPGARIARVDSSLPPEEFFERIIRAWRPVVVTGALDDAEWRGAAALARAPVSYTHLTLPTKRIV